MAQPQKVKIDVSAIVKLGYFSKISLNIEIDKYIEFYKKNLFKYNN